MFSAEVSLKDQMNPKEEKFECPFYKKNLIIIIIVLLIILINITSIILIVINSKSDESDSKDEETKETIIGEIICKYLIENNTTITKILGDDFDGKEEYFEIHIGNNTIKYTKEYQFSEIGEIEVLI